MRHFPIFHDLRARRVIVCGATETAVAKLRLILKTEARVTVFGEDAHPQIRRWADEARLTLIDRPMQRGDAVCAALVYGATEDAAEDARIAELGRACGALVNIVDNLEASDFITPAIVDRDPVTVAIGTEGAAPVLARRIKAMNEENLAPTLGTLARVGQAFRPHAEALPKGRVRREFWSRYYDEVGPRVLSEQGEAGLVPALEALLRQALSPAKTGGLEPSSSVSVARDPCFAPSPGAEMSNEQGHVALIGAGPGDPELLTLKARRLLHEADVVIHDRLVPAAILELARREAIVIEVGKTPHGPSWRQEDIDALLVEHATGGAHVARLKSGDPGMFGRLDEEMDALDAAGIPFEVVPGITSAAAAAASIKVSMTRRGRNRSVQFITGHDMQGFAEHDWRGLAAEGATAAIYMGVRAARFIQGRLMMHGAGFDTPVTAIENASRPEQKIVSATLGTLPRVLKQAGITGPAILFLGLSPRGAIHTLSQTSEPRSGASTIEAETMEAPDRVRSSAPIGAQA